jgi:hypothetical protein
VGRQRLGFDGRVRSSRAGAQEGLVEWMAKRHASSCRTPLELARSTRQLYVQRSGRWQQQGLTEAHNRERAPPFDCVPHVLAGLGTRIHLGRGISRLSTKNLSICPKSAKRCVPRQFPRPLHAPLHPLLPAIRFLSTRAPMHTHKAHPCVPTRLTPAARSCRQQTRADRRG